MPARLALRSVLLIAVSLVAGAALPAHALDVEGVHVADSVDVGGAHLVLNGAGVRHVTIFNVSVYVGALYLPHRTHDASTALSDATAKRFIAVFRRDVSHDQARGAFVDAIRAGAGASASAIESDVRTFETWLPAFAEGDRLVVTFEPGVGTTIEATQAHATLHASVAFGLALFGVWVGPHHVDDGLRDGLLDTH